MQGHDGAVSYPSIIRYKMGRSWPWPWPWPGNQTQNLHADWTELTITPSFEELTAPLFQTQHSVYLFRRLFKVQNLNVKLGFKSLEIPNPLFIWKTGNCSSDAVILPKEEVLMGTSVYMDVVWNKISINQPSQSEYDFFTNELPRLHKAVLFWSALYFEYLRPCKHSYWRSFKKVFPHFDYQTHC